MAQPAQPPVQPVAVDDKAVEEIAPGETNACASQLLIFLNNGI